MCRGWAGQLNRYQNNKSWSTALEYFPDYLYFNKINISSVDCVQLKWLFHHRFTVLPVNISIIFWDKINIMEYEALVIVLFHSFNYPNVKKHCTIEWVVTFLFNNVDRIFWNIGVIFQMISVSNFIYLSQYFFMILPNCWRGRRECRLKRNILRWSALLR